MGVGSSEKDSEIRYLDRGGDREKGDRGIERGERDREGERESGRERERERERGREGEGKRERLPGMMWGNFVYV